MRGCVWRLGPRASKRISGTDEKTAIGQLCTANVKANRIGPPGAEAGFEPYHGEGIAMDAALVQT